MKIVGAPLADELDRIEAVLGILPSGDRLAVDANGRFDLKTALEYAKALAPYKLKWYEEPGDPQDFQLLAEVAAAFFLSFVFGVFLFFLLVVCFLFRFGGLF